MPSLAERGDLRPNLPDGENIIPAAPTYAGRLAEAQAENRELREQNARLQLILESAVDYAIVTMDLHGCITSWNAGACRIFGYTEAEVLNRSGEIVFTSEDRIEGKFAAELHRAVETGRAANERWHLRRDGTRFWASGLMMPLLGADGQQQGFLNILRDRTQLRAEVDRRELMMAEMSHRVKNTFAMVQAVAAQSSRHSVTVEDFKAEFGERLAALARSHEVLIRGGWEDAPLRDVLEGALSAHGGAPGRIRLDGDAVLLPVNLVAVFTLAFHELATNAVKHGALSVPGGSVSVAWTINPAGVGSRRVQIVWREQGGPLVRVPQRRGFGSNLLQKVLGSQSGIDVAQEFRLEGLQCRISVPIGDQVPVSPP